MVIIHINPIKNEDDLTTAFARIDQIIDAKPGSPEYDELVMLGDLVYAYEHKHHPIALPDPIALLKSKLEDRDISLEALKEVLPNRSVRSSIFARRRKIPVKAMYAMVEKGWVSGESFFMESYFKQKV